ncbi:MAG: efflux RND transporter periplasmic adaptor subunit [Bacteroidetes bacterium]|nr:efflux RND transporter periplasmic adaptor subunit [Bacteroidota bacterium]
MQKITWIMAMTGMMIFLSCGKGNQQSNALAAKKEALESLKKKQAALAVEIKKLEDEIASLDTGKINSGKLVGVEPVVVEDFVHYIDLQGKIDADQISYIAPPNGQGGVVTALYVKEGEYVKKGQRILQMDDRLLQQQIKVSQTQLGLAKEVYQRTQKLWEQKIGSEIQLLQAKAQVEALERGIATAQEQIRQFAVVSPVDGIVDQVNVKVGELFTGANQLGYQIRVVDNSILKAIVEVPENYMSRVKTGSEVVVEIPDLQKTYKSTIRRTSQVINPNTRTFTLEAAIPGGEVRPNSVAAIKIKDYAAAHSIVIPLNIIQTDDKGKYVYVAEKDTKGNKVAVKKMITMGETYGDKAQILTGLSSDMILITEGYQSLYNGQGIRVE